MFVELLLFFVAALGYYLFQELWLKRQRAGIKYLPFKFPFGHLEKVIKREKTLSLVVNEFYDQSKDRLVGIYMVFKPVVLVRDPEIVKMIMTSHFESFSDRGVHPKKNKNALAISLFTMEIHDWRPLRAKLTPAFSAAKIRQMIPQIQDVASNFRELLLDQVKGNSLTEVRMKDLAGRFVIDAMAANIFGIKVNSMSDEDHPFRGLGKRLQQKRNTNFFEAIRVSCVFLWPRLAGILGISNVPDFASEFFINFVRETIEARERSPQTRHDVMQQLLQLRNTGSLDGDSWTYEKAKLPSMSIEEVASNAFLFYIAGSESSTSAICFCLFELSREPEFLQQAREEIDEALKKQNGELNYECLTEMKFLDKCILETIRKYPALPMLTRRCTKEFVVPETNQVIMKDQMICIPLRAIQTDPEYFPNPLRFNPNRCDPDDPDYSSVQYHAFGEGPKSCIAYRLGNLIVKTGLVTVLSNFDLEVGPKDDLNIFSIGDLGMRPRDDFTIRLARRS